MGRLRKRFNDVRRRLREEFDTALRDEYTPKQVAGSFAVGVFVTSLPTLGVGVIVLLAIAYLFAKASKLALFAAVVVFNPVVKWGVYGGSFWLGTLLMGSPASGTPAEISLSATPDIVIRLLVGNLILAVVFAVGAYLVAYRLTLEYRQRNGEIEGIEKAVEKLPKR